MKRLLLLLLTAQLIFSACGPKKEYLSPLEIENEKSNVKSVIADYNRAFEDKNFGKVVETLADEVIFFGTDSSEVIKTFADFKKAIEKQWQEYDKVTYGDLRDVSIQMDDNGTIASIIYGVHADYLQKDTSYHYYLRIARVLKKKNHKWLIVSGIVGIVRDDAPPRNIDTLQQLDN
ncbi:MAG: nuclear transport factor 2 family protein [Candidatus Kapabacteria bacterium]|nr:nuclear transport factor 2 family protein [Candidatus Kapabacteria bacterium]